MFRDSFFFNYVYFFANGVLIVSPLVVYITETVDWWGITSPFIDGFAENYG